MKQVSKSLVEKKSQVANVDTKTATIKFLETNNEMRYIKTMDKGQKYYSEEIFFGCTTGHVGS